MSVRLINVDGDNWRDVVAVSPKPSQERFVASTAYYLCLCHYGDDWHPLAIDVDGEIVGHVMWGEEHDSVWLGGLVIDAAAQGRGLGRHSVQAFLDRFPSDLALSYSPDNEIARSLYAEFGFVETGETDDDEVVARLSR